MGNYTAPPPNPLLSTSQAAAIATLQSDVGDLETAVGAYAGGADLATDVAALDTAMGTPGTVSTETDVWAALAALEARIVTLEGG